MRNCLGFLVLFFLFGSCTTENLDQHPNIIWITCEDISPTLSFYGDSSAQTPVLDRLAEQSLIYDNAFATVGVCAPSRSSIITGMYPVSIGTHNMRTGRDYSGWGTRLYNGESDAIDIDGKKVPLYSAVIPSEVKCFTEYLRAAGYFCSNNAKTDYQFAAPLTAWDENGPQAHWKHRKTGQPFFAVFNHEVTHESRMWMNKNLPMTVDPNTVHLPPYFPNDSVVRNDVARNYSNIELLDQQVGEKLKELEEAGVLDNTIIFFFSDHGGPLPRGKREHYDSGLRVPFLVKFPGDGNFERVDDLISFVDLAPTILSLAGIEAPEYMQGQAFLGKYKSKTERKYIYGSGDRFDEFSDRIRSIRNHRFMYVRNYHPELPAYKDVSYRKQMDMMNQLLTLKDEGHLNEDQLYFFRETKLDEEFYDCTIDSFQLHNLIDQPEYTNEIEELRKAMNTWQVSVGDLGFIPEHDLFLQMWPDGIQPQTADPILEIYNHEITASSTTVGASLAYILSDENFVPDLDSGWQLYNGPIVNASSKYIYIIAVRIGFKDSEIVKISLNE
ncbi:MAG: sulfatase [Prolixibacteraceae bacterium]